MAKTMIADLQVGQPIDDPFLLSRCDLKSTRTDSLYLDLEFMDRTGRISGRLWDATQEVFAGFAVDDFVHVKGKVETYKGELQVSVRSLSKADARSLRLRDFLPQSERDPKEMEAELRGILAQVEDADYRRLIEAVLSNEDLAAALRTAPAAVQNHHAYLGGLLEHTLSMAKLAVVVAQHYPNLRRDILLTGVLFHDIGKTREILYKRTFQFSQSGHLVGHLTQGVLILHEVARGLKDFPEEKVTLLTHLILSHHGSRDFGSPVLPMTAEAMALHYLDNLDAKMREVADKVDADVNPHSDFTAYLPALERRLYKK